MNVDEYRIEYIRIFAIILHRHKQITNINKLPFVLYKAICTYLFISTIRTFRFVLMKANRLIYYSNWTYEVELFNRITGSTLDLYKLVDRR